MGINTDTELCSLQGGQDVTVTITNKDSARNSDKYFHMEIPVGKIFLKLRFLVKRTKWYKLQVNI